MSARRSSRRSLVGSAAALCALALCGCGGSANAGGRLVTATPGRSTSTAPVVATTTPAPMPSATTPLTVDPEPGLRVLFTGDINPGRCPAQIALEADDFSLPYRAVTEALSAADLAVGSLDGSLTDIDVPAPCTPERVYNLIGPARTAEGLALAGFDVLSLATNHAQDCGRHGFVCDGRALADTLAALNAGGIAPVGAGATLADARRPIVIEQNGVRLAFLAVSAVGEFAWAGAEAPGIAPLSEASLRDVLADIRAARADTDAVIVLAHWGIEYDPTPSSDQRRWAERMIASGATLIVGNHPHVIQPVEPLGDGLVAYALGNFVFDQDPEATRRGLVLEATFSRQGLVAWRTMPIEIVELHRPEWR